MRRTAENRAGAVVHQNEIGDIDRQLPVGIEWMHGLHAGVETELLGGVDLGLCGAHAMALFDEGRELRILRRRGRRKRMVGRQRHELRAEQSVRPRGENLELGFLVRRRRRIERKAQQQSFRSTDPVLLHQTNFVRPAIELVERLQKIFRVVADLEKPLRQFALLDGGAGAPAASVDDLLVGKHRLVDGIPVDLGLLALDQPGFEEVEKHFLLVLVISRVAGGDLARPVERKAHRLQLLFHRRDVVVGPGFRMHLAVDRGVLGRHAEGVPAHRVQNGISHGAFEARYDVTHRVVAHVPHVDAPRRVGKHLEHVIFRPRVAVLGREDTPIGPDLLPTGLGLAGVIALVFARRCGHGTSCCERGTDTKPGKRSTAAVAECRLQLEVRNPYGAALLRARCAASRSVKAS